MIKRNLAAMGIICSIAPFALFAQQDMAGAADHPSIPRISESVIVGYSSVDFDEGEFLALNEEGDLKRQYVGGQITKYVYLTPDGTTPIAALRNYQEAFENLGEVSEVYFCGRGDCDRRIGRTFIWSDEAAFANELDDLSTIYSSHLFHINQTYWYAKITSETGTYDVSFYASERADYRLNQTDLAPGRVLVHIQIVGDDEFESDLEFVEASAIESAIVDTGHIALYGLFFDTGEDQLTTDSAPTLSEIAKVLEGSEELDVYVVGHTDSVGSVVNNLDLSQRRAQAVVQSLSQEYGIASDRLTALGAGLAAPVSTNDTEAGRALNRRVELVKR